MSTKAKSTKSAKMAAAKSTKGRIKSVAEPKTNPPAPAQGSQVAREIAKLAALTKHDLQAKYEEVFGHKARTHNSNQLRNVIARRLADEASEKGRTKESGEEPRENKFAKDPRTPAVGAIIEREYNGKVHKVKVLADGFEYAAKKYRSLSGLALEICGTVVNGWVWFKLTPHAAARKGASHAA